MEIIKVLKLSLFYNLMNDLDKDIVELIKFVYYPIENSKYISCQNQDSRIGQQTSMMGSKW